MEQKLILMKMEFLRLIKYEITQIGSKRLKHVIARR